MAESAEYFKKQASVSRRRNDGYGMAFDIAAKTVEELTKERDDIAQLCDPAGIVNENTLLKDQARMLENRYEILSKAHVDVANKRDSHRSALMRIVREEQTYNDCFNIAMQELV